MTDAPTLPTPTLARDRELAAVAAALSAPFDPKDVKFKPQQVKNNRALAMAYIDARLIQDRLDRVLGVENWQDRYRILADGSVMCRLQIQLGGRWIAKSDVGSPSSQPDSGDRLKAAFSDALKRAAVKFGIGRYLYRLSAQWVDYDPVKKQLVGVPTLPAFALPHGHVATSTEAKPTPATLPAKISHEAVPPEKNTAKGHGLPATGQELQRRLQDYDAKLAAQKLCARGALLDHVTRAGVKAGYAANVSDWNGSAIPFAVSAVKEFERALRTNATVEHGAAA